MHLFLNLLVVLALVTTLCRGFFYGNWRGLVIVGGGGAAAVAAAMLVTPGYSPNGFPMPGLTTQDTMRVFAVFLSIVGMCVYFAPGMAGDGQDS